MTSSVRVVPAILTDDEQALPQMIRQAEDFTDYVQIDFMDGRFVPSHSIPCQSLSGISTSLTWEAHIMVEEPENQLKCLRDAGARRVIFHVEATDSPAAVIKKARQLKLGTGLAVNPGTPVSAVASLLNQVDTLLLLTVNPGYYGSQFLPDVLSKIAELRGLAPAMEIGVDGGIKENNISRVARMGVDTIYVGSAIFMQPDPAQAYRHLQSLAQNPSHP